MVKRTAAFTFEPETPAPDRPCPICDSQLIYRQTVLAGAHLRERWDYLNTCGRPLLSRR